MAPRPRAKIGRRTFWALATLSLATGVPFYLRRVRPRLLRWGATIEEQTRTLAGDELLGSPEHYTQAVTVAATPEAIWPWLIQMGQGRAAFYSHSWVENILGGRMHNADAIVPDWQQLEVGDWVRTYWDVPGVGPIGQRVKMIEPPRVLVLQGTRGSGWIFQLEPLEDGTTRLLLRDYRMPLPRWLLPLHLFLAEPLHIYQMTGMLQGLKERAEGPREAALNT